MDVGKVWGEGESVGILKWLWGASFADLGGLEMNGVFFFGGEALEVAHLHDDSGIFCEGWFVLLKEIPIEGGERAGAWAEANGGIEAASCAVVGHPLDVFAGRNVGL